MASFGWTGAQRYRPLVGKRFPEYYRSRAAMIPTLFTDMRDSFYTREFAERLRTQPFDDVAARLGGPMNGRSVLDQMLYVDTKTWLPDELLVKADKMTMATSTELRVPLLDFQVLEFAASLPSDYKVKGWSTKRVLREALKESVPPEILQRKKAGFPVPYGSWLNGELKDFIHDTLLGDAELTQYFDKAMLRKLVLDAPNRPTAPKEIFSLVVLELWHQQFVSSHLEAVPS